MCYSLLCLSDVWKNKKCILLTETKLLENMRNLLPGHDSRQHFWVSELVPMQGLPPKSGDGFEHSLCLCWIPKLQVELQAYHSCQSDHIPSKNKRN